MQSHGNYGRNGRKKPLPEDHFTNKILATGTNVNDLLIPMNENWVRNPKEIKALREELLELQDGRCPVLSNRITNGHLDHDHESGVVRGTLLPAVNMVEGKIKRLYDKYVKRYCHTSYGDFLIKLGTYIKHFEDGECKYNQLHHGTLDKMKNKVRSWTVETIEKRLYEDFGLNLRPYKLNKAQKAYVYLCFYRDKLEEANGHTPEYDYTDTEAYKEHHRKQEYKLLSEITNSKESDSRD